MARTADPINPLCQASAGEFHSGLQSEISRETEPRPDESEGDAEGMQSQIQAQPGACAAILALADDTRITASEHRVFALIGKGYQKRADMAAIMKKTVVTVARAISKLVSLGLVEREVVPGKASKLRISGRIIDAARIIQDTPTRITVATSITEDTATRITGDTGHADDTGPAVDKPAAACIGTGARAETLTFINTIPEAQSETVELVLVGEDAFALAETAPPKPNKRGTRMTADWRPGPSALKEAVKLGIVNGWCEATLENFVDYWLGVAGAKGLKSDWDATFRNELRKEARARRHVPIKHPTSELNIHDQRTGGADTGASYGRAKRNHHTDLLLRDVLDDSPSAVGGLDFIASK